MITVKVTSKDEEMAREAQIIAREAAKEAIGFEQEGGVFVNPLLKSDDDGTTYFNMTVGSEGPINIGFTSDLDIDPCSIYKEGANPAEEK